MPFRIWYAAGVDNLELVQEYLAKTPVSKLPAEARAAKVPFGTLQKIKYGTTKDPGYKTVKKFAAYCRRVAAAAKRKRPSRAPRVGATA